MCDTRSAEGRATNREGPPAMPATFPEWNDAENRFVDRDYLSLGEVATMLHISRTTAYGYLKSERWPHLKIANHVWIGQDDVRAILASLRHNDPAVPDDAEPGPLGLALPPDDAGGDQDPGGVR